MKERASFTFDKKTMDLLDSLMENGNFRNKSHLVEIAIKNLDFIKRGENERES